MKYARFLIFFFAGMAVAFFVSYTIEAMNQEPHEGALLFESFAWYSSVFLIGVFGFVTGRARG